MVDDDAPARALLKSAALGIAGYKQMESDRSLENAARRLSSAEGEPFDVVFISYEFDYKKVGDFIQKSKNERRGRDSAYILLLSAVDQDTKTVTRQLLQGADGFLLKPYSVDNVRETTEIGVAIKNKRREEREQAMMMMMLNDGVKFLDEVARNLFEGEQAGRMVRQLREVREGIADLGEDLRDKLKKEAKRVLNNLPPPPPRSKRLEEILLKFRGTASERLRRRIQRAGIKTERKVVAEDKEKEEEVNSKHLSYLPEKGLVKLDVRFCDGVVADEILDTVEELLKSGNREISLDLSQVEAIDSYSIGRILRCKEISQEGSASFSIKNATQFFKEGLELFGLAGEF